MLLYILTYLHIHIYTYTECSVYILNDHIREGNESFSTVIRTDDPSIHVAKKKITVIIQDPEDGK